MEREKKVRLLLSLHAEEQEVAISFTNDIEGKVIPHF